MGLKRWLSDRFVEIGFLWLVVLGVVALAIIAFGSMLIQEKIYPWWLSVQRESVEESKSFTDSNNNMLQTYILEHSRLDTKVIEAGDDQGLVVAYKAQQRAIVEKMCRQISTMEKDTVNPDTLFWLNSHGGCK